MEIRQRQTSLTLRNKKYRVKARNGEYVIVNFGYFDGIGKEDQSMLFILVGIRIDSLDVCK